MKLHLIITLSIILLACGSIYPGVGDPDPNGIEDTIALVTTVDWQNNSVITELYCFTDYNIVGASSGFTWQHSTASLTMDSAVATPLALDSSELGVYLYENDDITITNTTERFIFAMASLGDGLPGETNGRRLWATYYFSMNWDAGDCVIFDTLTYSNGSYVVFSLTGGSYYTPNVVIQEEVCSPLEVDAIIIPDHLSALEAFELNPDEAEVIFGDFRESNGAYNIDLLSIRINGDVIPTSAVVMPSYPGFDGDVVHLTVPKPEFLNSYSPIWDSGIYTFEVTGQFEDATEFTKTGQVNLTGHNTGDVNNDGFVNVGDLTFMVNYVFYGGVAPAIIESGDIDCDGGINVTDLSILVNYVFKNGPTPIKCN